LFIGWGDGEQFDAIEKPITVWRGCTAKILNEQVQQMPGVLPKAAATRFGQDHTVVHEQQGGAGQRLDFVHEDLAAVEHGGHFDLIPFSLGIGETQMCDFIKERLQARDALGTRHVTV
jgi:hypothetical protein